MPDPNWRPTADITILEKRAEVLWALRHFFHERKMLEVHTPVLSQDTVLDRHIDPVELSGDSLMIGATHGRRLFLQTSPEFGMKRLIAAGMGHIYQVSPVFRSGERGAFHNPEFTMVEWYRVGDDLQSAVAFFSDLIEHVLPHHQVQVMTYQAAFQLYADCDPLVCTIDGLAQLAAGQGLGVHADWSQDLDDWLNLIFAEIVQPRLGLEAPVIVTHYPASQSALAQLDAADPRIAERFELFVHGVELANGYHELLSAQELRARNSQVTQQRQSDGKAALRQESYLLAAMDHGLPDCSGCALGLDRLMMVLCRAKSIDEVIAFPIERA